MAGVDTEEHTHTVGGHLRGRHIVARRCTRSPEGTTDAHAARPLP